MDNSLLQQVYRQYSREIYLYLYTLCKNHHLAEELMQEAFFKAILSLPDGHTNVRAWLYTVARNLCFNSMQRENNRQGGEPDENLPDERTDPENEVIGKIVNQMLYSSLLRLDDVKREIILLHYFSGMSQKDIAALLGLTPENVRVLSYRAKKELKHFMEEQGYEVS